MHGDASTRHNASRRTGMQTQQQQFSCGPASCRARGRCLLMVRAVVHAVLTLAVVL